MSKSCYAMVITPHPDDAEYGVAGTVVKWVREGKEVIYVVCTNGNKGSNDPQMTLEELAQIREREQLAAAKVLGVKEVIFLRYEDQGLEDTPGFRKQIVRQLRIYKPEIVVTSDPYRSYIWHRDHRITGQVVMDAVFPYARDRLAYPDLLAQGIEPHKVKEVFYWGADKPNYFSDITDTWETKMAALRCHHSQVGDFPDEWKEFIKQRHQAFAEGQSFPLAEAFYRAEQWL